MIVSVKKANTYEEEIVQQAVDAHFAALGLEQEIKPEYQVVIKPNLLAARKPQAAATTHPLLLHCIIRALHRIGVSKITVADSPGGPYTPAALKNIYSVCGYRMLEEDAQLNLNTNFCERETAEGFITRRFPLIEPIANADYIINVAKLKTHTLTGISGGIKNLFGCIPGLQKPEFHYRFPEIEGFSGMLLELAQTVKPNVTFVDAIVAMEGEGPNMGTPKEFGYTFASKHLFAQDFVLADAVGIDRDRVVMLRKAKEQGLCDPTQIRLVGDELNPEPLKLPESVTNDYLSGMPRFMRGPVGVVAKAFLKPMPRILKDRCIGCGKCAESCPQHIIQVTNRKAKIGSRKSCISCFCCQEMCPAHAIEVRRRLKTAKKS